METPDTKRFLNSIKSSLPLIAMIAALLALRWTLVEPYVVPTSSMEPTLKKGDRLYALKCAYDIRFPFTEKVMFRTGSMKRGDIILFLAPHDPGIMYVKRLIGLPGDKIKFVSGVLYVNGQAMEKQDFPNRDVMYDIESKETKKLYTEKLDGVKHYVILDTANDNSIQKQLFYKRYYDETEVPPNHFFASGDNRDGSYDSRAWGFVPYENMKGKAMFIWLSAWTDNARDPHQYEREPFIMKVIYFVVDFFTFFIDLARGQAHIRFERIGTLLQ